MAEDMVRLKGMNLTADRRLDRIPQFDPKSRRFGVAAVLPDKPQRSYTWRVPSILDQGTEGACVGFGWTAELNARPVVNNLDDAYAISIYHEARLLDEWPGEDYSGTSVLAGAKAILARGHIREYRWGFSLDDLVMALGYAGPVVLGLNWYTGMMNTDPDGFIKPTGQIEGGHCVAATSVNVRRRQFAGPNNWNASWGEAGYWKMSFDDMDRLLHEQGEQCIPMGRQKIG